MKYPSVCYCLLCLLFLSCNNTNKSSRNPALVNTKAQGFYIYHELNLYSLEYEKFPNNLSEIESDLNKKYNLGSEQIAEWSYASIADGKKCLLIRKEIVDGYFVYLNMTGRIVASYKLPDGDDLILAHAPVDSPSSQK